MVDVTSRKMVGFIDLLGTKESSKISVGRFQDSIKYFLYHLIDEIHHLEPETYSVQYLSDSAFIELSINDASFEFLRNLRSVLFRKGIFFKCALVAGELKPQNIDADFIAELTKEMTSGYLPSSLNPEEISRSMKGFFFSGQTIQAYLLHEDFKGVGYIAGRGLVAKANEEFVTSIYYTSDTFRSAVSYSDLSYSPDREVAGWSPDVESDWDVPAEWEESLSFIDNFLSFAEKASLKKAAYSKYYIPALISMARSSDFSTISSDEKSLTGTPTFFRKLIDEARLNKPLAQMKGMFDLQCAVLDAALSQLKVRLQAAPVEALEERQELGEIQRLVCKYFGSMPKFRSNIQNAKSSLIGPENKEVFLEHLVARSTK